MDKTSKSKIEIPFNEYIEEIDISANGKYIAAGTGGSVYFFETYISQDRGKVFDCPSVTEPTAESEMRTNFGVVDQGSPEMIAKSKDRQPSLLEMILDFLKNIFKPKSESTIFPNRQESIQQQESAGSSEKAAPSGQAVCGNDLCEPGLGETQESCPKDCSAGD